MYNSPPIAKKTLGQHWLTDDAVLQAICDMAEVKKGDTVLEIGPGTGELTARLLARDAKVVAVELDERLAKGLYERFKSLPFSLNTLSIFDYDLSQLPADYKIVANIPYYLSSHLLHMLSETLHKPSTAVLLIQKEVAQRIAASPGAMSLLSVSVQFYARVELGPIVPAKLFTPSPKVDSQVIKLTYRQKPLFKDINTKKFFRIVKAGFANRRKTLVNSLAGGLHLSKTETHSYIEKAHLNPNIRPQQLTLEDWYSLYNLIP